MNPRLLGTLCIIGGAAYLLNGLRYAIIGGFVQQDLLGVVLSVIWALGGICGVLGMIALCVTGTNRVTRTLSYLPIAGFLLFLAGNLFWVMNPVVGFNPPGVLGFFALLIGLLMNGFFTLFAGVWTGWKKAVAFLPAIMPFVGLAIGSLIGIEGVVNLSLVALSWMLLGYTVTTSPERTLVAANA
jgi:hypothetical protein